MAKRVKNKTRKRRTYRKKTNRVSNRKRINKKKTMKRKNIMIGGSLKEEKLIGDLDLDLSKIMDMLRSFGVVGADSISSILTDTAKIGASIISATGYITDKVKGQKGGAFGLNFILKKIAKAATFGLLLEALNYFLVKPNLTRIFKYINSKAFLTFDGSNIGICFVIDGEEYKIHLKNSSTFPLWINIKDYIDALLPIIIKVVYSNSIVQKVFAAKKEPINSEEELLHYVEMELLKRQKESTEGHEGHEGGGQIGGFLDSVRARELYKKTKERLSDAKQRFSNKMSETGSKMKDSIFSNSLIGAVCSFFILRFIYIVYENIIDSNGRWCKLKFNQENILGVSISQNLGVDGKFIPITTVFVQDSIAKKIKELQQESKKQEGEVEVAEDVKDSEEETPELSSTSSQPASPPTEPTPSSLESVSPPVESPSSPLVKPPQAPDAAFSEAEIMPDQTSSGTQDPEVIQAVQAAQREEIRRRCIEREGCDRQRFGKKRCRNKCNREASR
jgi:hypothetical protein